jgi:hypothetical protein
MTMKFPSLDIIYPIPMSVRQHHPGAPLTRLYGAPEISEPKTGLTELHFMTEETEIWICQQDKVMRAIRSAPRQRIQAFFRPCSGLGGKLTATGSASGLPFFFHQLFATAFANATAAYFLFLPGACRVCNPCICVPIGPYLDGVSATPGPGFLQITVTVDVSGTILCI